MIFVYCLIEKVFYVFTINHRFDVINWQHNFCLTEKRQACTDFAASNMPKSSVKCNMHRKITQQICYLFHNTSCIMQQSFLIFTWFSSSQSRTIWCFSRSDHLKHTSLVKFTESVQLNSTDFSIMIRVSFFNESAHN